MDRVSQPGSTLMRFSTTSANIGAGPMEIRGGEINGDEAQNVYQRIYDNRGGHTDRLAGEFIYHPEHGRHNVRLENSPNSPRSTERPKRFALWQVAPSRPNFLHFCLAYFASMAKIRRCLTGRTAVRSSPFSSKAHDPTDHLGRTGQLAT
jgi:hypothetical protein